MIPFFVKRLMALREALSRLRNECNARMYSSSVLLVYDNDNVEKMECRILDFAKTYLDITQVATTFQERLEDCEDDVVPAITNLVRVLRTIGGISECP
jgi:hypothetical protein